MQLESLCNAIFQFNFTSQSLFIRRKKKTKNLTILLLPMSSFSALFLQQHLISETPLATAQLGFNCFDYKSMTRVAITNTLPPCCSILCSDTGDPIILLMCHPESWIKENKPALTSKWTNNAQYFRLIAFFVDTKLELRGGGGNGTRPDAFVDLWIKI